MFPVIFLLFPPPASLNPFYRAPVGTTVVGLTEGSDQRHWGLSEMPVNGACKSTRHYERGQHHGSTSDERAHIAQQNPGNHQFLKNLDVYLVNVIPLTMACDPRYRKLTGLRAF
jgi:hypothetical protein